MNNLYKELNQGTLLRRLQQLEAKHVRDYNKTEAAISLTLALHMREQIDRLTGLERVTEINDKRREV